MAALHPYAVNRDLGFTNADRVENIRRVGEVAKLMTEAGLIVICSFISPLRVERRMVRELTAPTAFLEIFVDTPLEECTRRDLKGLYAKARAGCFERFTGLDSPTSRQKRRRSGWRRLASHPRRPRSECWTNCGIARSFSSE